MRCRNRPTDPVFTSYVYSVHSNGGLTGDVTITAYNAKRQLVSGTYTVRALEQTEPDPSTSYNGPKCTIILEGEFENLKVKPQ